MVSALLNDALSDPLSVLLSLHNGLESNTATLDLAPRVAQHFKTIFKDGDAFKQIPALDVLHPPENYRNERLPLVRFRAMVQDTSASPEVYPSLLRSGNPGGWGLAETLTEDELPDLHLLKERDVVWAVSVPGESAFVTEDLDEVDLTTSRAEATVSKFRHKDPLMREKHVGVQVKLYDTTAAPLKPAELHTFVGFLSLEHLSSAEDGAFESMQAPTLHTLFSVKHTTTLVPYEFPLPDHTINTTSGSDPLYLSCSSIKDELIQWISDEALGGDRDAAQWVLLVSIAKVQSRQPPLFPPSLTLSRFPQPEADAPVPQTPALVHVLRSLLPLFVDVPLSLPLLNSRPFTPESRDESLHSGLLQLPAGTTVLLSDTSVQEGTINETGVKNIQALRNALTMQTVDYIFPFTSPYQFPTDLSFIFLTEGKASAFAETQLYIPMECQNNSGCFRRPEEIRYPPPSLLNAFRRLLGGAMVGDIKVTEEISQYIQTEFVRDRQDDKTTTADDLMTRMSIARLLALLHHHTELTTEVWQEAKSLDIRRKQRC